VRRWWFLELSAQSLLRAWKLAGPTIAWIDEAPETLHSLVAPFTNGDSLVYLSTIGSAFLAIEPDWQCAMECRPFRRTELRILRNGRDR
jgi:hypothetical protein